MRRYTIVLADDHPAFREGIAMKLGRESDLDVIAQASNGREALDATLDHSPDLLLVDMDMPEMDGLEVAKELHRRGVRTKVLPLSGHSDPEYVLGTLENGAEGYLMKDESLNTIVEAVRTVLRGGVYISGRVSQQIISNRLKNHRRRELKASAEERLLDRGMTPRLLEILQLTSQGLNNEEIAKHVYRSEHTVRNQIDAIKSIIGVRWRPAMVAWAWRMGVLDIDLEQFEEMFMTTEAARGYRGARLARLERIDQPDEEPGKAS